MANTRLVTLNATGGAFITVSATMVTRRVEVIEDGSADGGTGQGLQYQFDDGFGAVPNTPNTAKTYQIQPQTEPIILGEVVPFGMGYGRVIGTPPDNSGGYSIPATPLINLRSATASTTIVRVTEFS